VCVDFLCDGVCKPLPIFHASGIQSQSGNLLKVVEKLGPALTNKNPELREKGTRILAEVLHNLPKDCLQESEVYFIITFFCDRLKDHNAVIPAALQGILAVVCRCRFTYYSFANMHVDC
jgi:DNA repair/transcription protein MET18/MMS19